jgi:hypothetical protein
MARVSPVLVTEPDGGQVVVTRFECATLRGLLTVRLLHLRLRRDVRRNAPGFVGVKTLIDWPSRTLLSISLWKDLDSVYEMGMVPRHVSAVRLPGRLGARTTCGVFCFVGDWRRVMFASSVQSRSPLYPLPPEPTAAHQTPLPPEPTAAHQTPLPPEPTAAHQTPREEGSHGHHGHHTDRSRLRRDGPQL